MTEQEHWEAERLKRFDALLAELDREIAARTIAYPERVKQGRMTAELATWRQGILKEIRAEVAGGRDFNYRPVEGGTFKWEDKLKHLEEELDYRRRYYPDRIAKGSMTERQASEQLQAIEAIRALYWNEMLAWSPPPGPARDYLAALRGINFADKAAVEAANRHPGAPLYRELVRDHARRLEADEHNKTEALL